MSKLRAAVGVVLLSILLSGVAAVANDWPQWRGPNRDGHSGEIGLLKEWPTDGPKLLWQVPDLGCGYSTPAVAGGRLYVMRRAGLDNEFVTARDTANGRLLWSTADWESAPGSATELSRRALDADRRWDGALCASAPMATSSVWRPRPARCAGRRAFAPTSAVNRATWRTPSRRWWTATLVVPRRWRRGDLPGAEQENGRDGVEVGDSGRRQGGLRLDRRGRGGWRPQDVRLHG